MEQIRRIMRPTDVPDTGLLCDLLWSDPDKDVQGWGENDRGVSFTFGADVVAKFLNRHDMDLIARAHQVVGTLSYTRLYLALRVGPSDCRKSLSYTSLPLPTRTRLMRHRSLSLSSHSEDGYEFFAKRQLVTLFSAPNYCGEFDNAGGEIISDM